MIKSTYICTYATHKDSLALRYTKFLSSSSMNMGNTGTKLVNYSPILNI